MSYPFQFEKEIALEAIIYIANCIRDEATYLRVSKILYFADKLHLEKYGRFVFGESYIAMKDGPVPSNAYDMMKEAKNRQSYKDDFAVEMRNYPTIIPVRKPDESKLSPSERMCLDEAISRYAYLPSKTLWNTAHAEFAYNATERNKRMELEHIVEGMEDSELILQHIMSI